ncbi:MAG TPA: AraC family transcriptional regulator [Thermomicrobiales bacterium]|nr:AraC family transcriptional regulator [Thermomicrobiales bacterium]
MTDPFAEVVALLRPSLSFSKATSGSGVWRVDGSGEDQPVFCVVLEGATRLEIEGDGAFELNESDFILVPAAGRFSMGSLERGDEAAAPSRITRLADEVRHGDPDGPANMRALVGRLAFASPDAGLLVALLPRIIHVRGQKRMATIVQLIRSEAQEDRPARAMVLECLLQVMLLEALRSTADSVTSPGLLRGMADARLAVAIRRMHESPEQDWTVEQLANAAALSRSVFFERFRRAVGVAPMEYLLSWRMALAKDLLRRRDGGIKEIARRVGYGSASAFSVAFTRSVGVPPSRYALEAGGGADAIVA